MVFLCWCGGVFCVGLARNARFGSFCSTGVVRSTGRTSF